MNTMSQERFIDLYELLQVDPNADPDTIERVFRLLAKRYHPDNKNTGNADRFAALSEAHNVLSDPEKRAGYDAGYETDKQRQWSVFLESPMAGEDEDQRTQRWILSLLYSLRRRGSKDPGMGEYELQNYLEMAEGEVEFHIWYLKEKGLIARTDTGKFGITVEGVDWMTGKDRLLRRDRLIGGGDGRDFSPGSPDSSEDVAAEPGPHQTKALPAEEPAA